MSKQLFEPGKSEAFRTNEEIAAILNKIADTGITSKGEVIKLAISAYTLPIPNQENADDLVKQIKILSTNNLSLVEDVDKLEAKVEELEKNKKALELLLEDAVNKPSGGVNTQELQDANQKLQFQVQHLEEELAKAKASATELKAIQVNQILITLNIPQMKTLGRVRKSLLAIDVEVTEEPGDVLLAAATVLDQHMQNMVTLLKPYKNLINDGN